MDALIGKTLHRYQITNLLGEGGMGEVYKARDPILQRDIAVKVMHPHFARQPNFRERFLQEARTAARLDHPNIVKVYDSGEVEGTLYIVMEFIAGSNLRKIISDLRSANRWIVYDETVQLVRQICLALDYAHRQGVLHRDIKPDNIMLKPEPIESLPYHPVLTDLGLAKLLEGLPLTHEGESMGTPSYMSPEQALGRTLDARSDVYSLGILLYELAVGRLPFPAKTLSEAIRYHTKEPPPPPHNFRQDLPKALEEVILKALSKEPDDRYPRAANLASALQDILLPVTRTMQIPVEQETAVSLVTQYQESLVEERGTSIVDAFPAASTPLRQDHIQVMEHDRTVRSVAIQPQGLTIGRGEENDVALDDPKASRQHARIEVYGLDYRVIDLNSTNGTFLANAKLLPGVPEVWLSEKPLRIGNTWLRLVRGGVSKPISLAGATLQDANIAPPSAMAGKIGILLDVAQYTVAPGSSVALALMIINQGGVVDHYRTTLEGIPTEWVLLPPEIRLMPGVNQEVKITISPPRLPQSRAGQYPLNLRVASLDDPKEAVELKVALTVEPFYAFSLDIRPKKQSGVSEGNFTIQAANQGNSDLTLKFTATDAEEGCLYTFTPSYLSTTSGKETTIGLKVQSKRPLQGEQAKPYLFTVTAQASEVPDLIQQAQGEWDQVVPSFEISLRPQKQSGIARGNFTVALVNQSGMALTIQLEGRDPEEGCQYIFTPPQVALPGESEQSVQLRIQPKTPLPSEQPKIYPFTVAGRTIGTSPLTRQAMGQWDHVPPSLEVNLRPQKQSGETEVSFKVQLLNHSNSPLTLQFEAADPEEDCLFQFDPPGVKVEASQEADVSLKVQSKKPYVGVTSKSHPLTITVRIAEAPALSRKVQGEWEQLPPPKPVELPESVVVLPEKKPNKFGGCIILLIGLVLTIVGGYLAAVIGQGFVYHFVSQHSGPMDTGAWGCAIPTWLGGLVLSIVITRKIWKRQPSKRWIIVAIVAFFLIVGILLVLSASGNL